MTRRKKARRVGSEGPAEYVERKMTKEDVAALAKKRAAKRKGLKAGTRNHVENSNRSQTTTAQAKDPRVGSKKAIPLIVEAQPHPKSAQAKKVRRLSAEQELEQLENDTQLNVLVERIERGEKLGSGLQDYVDEKLDRIEVLMNQLGLFETEKDVPEKATKKSKPRTEEDLFEAFTKTNFDEI